MVAPSADQDRLRLMEQVARRIHEATYGRIRDLAVEDVEGELVVRGKVRSHHVRQLALQGAIEILNDDPFRPIITVG
jgi:hypothetical protein